MGREFCINCPADEQQDLRLAAGYLEKKYTMSKPKEKLSILTVSC